VTVIGQAEWIENRDCPPWDGITRKSSPAPGGDPRGLLPLNRLAGLRRSIAEYPPLLRLLGAGMFINSVGLAFIWPLTTVYIHTHLGRSLTVAGLVLLFNQAAAALGSLAGGLLFDKIGPRRVILAGLLGSAVAIAVPGVTEQWPLYVAAMVLFGFAVALVRPAIFSLAARTWPGQGRRPFNFLYVMNNVGVAVGTGLGGLLVSYSFRLAFLATAATTLLFAGIAFGGLRAGRLPPTAAEPSGPVAAGGSGAIPWPPIVALFAGFFVLHVTYGQWQSTMPVYLETLGISLTRYSLLWTVNGLLIVLGQPLLSLLLRRLRTTPVQLLFGTLLYAGSFTLARYSHQYTGFVAGMVALTLGEMILWPGIPAAVAQLSPPQRAGFLQGFIDDAMLLGRMLAPIFGGLLYDRAGIAAVLTVVAALEALPALCILFFARITARSRGVGDQRRSVS